MLKKITIVLMLFLFFNVSSNAQPFRVSIDYHSFDPFIHFRLDFNNHRYARPYRMAYFKGYMDGVNDHYRYAHRYRAMVRVENAYEAGYRDGYRDRGLLIQIRGRDWLHRHRFGYRDYYSPSYSVRIWLDNITLAFLNAPARRLPPGWQRKVHPRVRRYRGWMKWRHNRRGYNDFDDYYEEYYEDRREDYEDYYEDYYEDWEDDDRAYGYFKDVRKHYRKRIKKFHKKAREARKKYRKKSREARKKFRERDRNILRRIDYEPDRQRIRSDRSSRRGKAKVERHKSGDRKEHRKRGRENRARGNGRGNH